MSKNAFDDGAMFKHDSNVQAFVVYLHRDFCGMYFGLAPNFNTNEEVDHSPAYLKASAQKLAWK